jgi:hypothetical protein
MKRFAPHVSSVIDKVCSKKRVNFRFAPLPQASRKGETFPWQMNPFLKKVKWYFFRKQKRIIFMTLNCFDRVTISFCWWLEQKLIVTWSIITSRWRTRAGADRLFVKCQQPHHKCHGERAWWHQQGQVRGRSVGMSMWREYWWLTGLVGMDTVAKLFL